MNVQDHDFSKKFFNGGKYPVYNYSKLQEIKTDTTNWKIEKIPMFVDGFVTWTHFKITLKGGGRTEPYQTDADIRLTLLEGSLWLLIMYKGSNGGDIIEAGDIVIIPNGSTYTILNQSRHENCVYTLDANTLLEIEG